MFRNPLIIGIDIGHYSIKAVVLRQKKSSLELAAFTEVVLPAAVVNEQHSVNAPALLSAMRKLKKNLPLGAKNVVLALPDSAVISKVIQLDSHLSDDEAVFAVEQAMSAASPFPVEDLRIDFFPLASETFSEPAQTQPYQVFAARRETVDSRVEAVRKARLQPQVVELQTHGLLWLEAYLAEQLSVEGHWGVVDIGKCLTAFCVRPSGGVAYHRELAFGCQNLTRGENPDESEAQIVAISPDQMEQFTKQLVDNLKRQLQLYNSTHPRATLQGIWLCGGGQNAVVVEMLERMLEIDVRWMHPLASFNRAHKMDVAVEQGSFGQYAVAAGLALRGGTQL
ncbi:type IV pilus biogenesis protein PilM [Photobacterium nomapromontoriensis]|uniref:type IV pilus biogenesis protein PilM n=1 Tax=Photobacterium nomapromontoriensis TaxID=2910237 RepID=UPI003D0BAEF7